MKKNLRYQTSDKVSTIMNCKTIICRILKWVVEIRIDALVSEFLEEFRLSKEPHY